MVRYRDSFLTYRCAILVSQTELTGICVHDALWMSLDEISYPSKHS